LDQLIELFFHLRETQKEEEEVVEERKNSVFHLFELRA
jgi:hypothetical protein